MSTWKRVDPTSATKVGWRTVTTKTFEAPNGEQVTYDLLHADGQEFASVIGLTDDDKVVVGREYCPGPEKEMDDLPGGFVDPGESPDAAVRREFLEETGFEAKNWKYLGIYHKDKYMNATWHAFLATGCTRVRDQKLETEEFIDVGLLSIDEFLDNAKSDKITDHGAVLMAYDDLVKMKEKK